MKVMFFHHWKLIVFLWFAVAVLAGPVIGRVIYENIEERKRKS